ncbi:MAG: hypothetical protein R2787_10900 [Saprospiraceae bacterium]|nr:hypothetical protein [Saprospiraceae bacterium]MCB9311866.1 hypothetical protein [Lewinellaceae bacterium]HRW74297.1 hypothetical protein [Saprospiraceae bacterium]
MSLLFTLLLSAFLYSTPVPVEPIVPDGIYLVLDQFDVQPQGIAVGQLIPYSHDFLDDDEGEARFLAVDPVDFVPLQLSTAPEGVVQKDKRINLLLTLESASAKRLAEFSTRHVNQRVATVINGQAVTLHIIRMPITEGKLQVTRCTDHACEKLLVALKDNVVQQD